LACDGKHLAKQGNLRRDGIYSLLKELRSFGYVRSNKTRDEQGAYNGIDYYFHEIAEATDPCTELPDTAKPDDVLGTEVYLEPQLQLQLMQL